MCAKILRFLLKPLGRVLSIRASRVYTRLRKSNNNLPLPVASRSLASFSSAAAFSNSLFKLSISVFSAIIDNPANREKCNDYRKTLEQKPNYVPLLAQLWAHGQMRDFAHFQRLGGWNDTLSKRITIHYFLICSCSRSVLDQHKGACSADSLSRGQRQLLPISMFSRIVKSWRKYRRRRYRYTNWKVFYPIL